MPGKLLIVGEHNPAWETHRATAAALAHAQQALGTALPVEWRSTADAAPGAWADAAGCWIATGLPYKSMAGALAAIRHARERGVPCLGTCQGFQHLLLEHAQAFLGIAEPAHAEYDPQAAAPFIAPLACSLKGTESEVALVPGTRAHAIYGTSRATEKFYCSHGLNPAFATRLAAGPLRISGTDAGGEIRIVELPALAHPFFLGTLFVPQARSREGAPHPLVAAFVRAAAAA